MSTIPDHLDDHPASLSAAALAAMPGATVWHPSGNPDQTVILAAIIDEAGDRPAEIVMHVADTESCWPTGRGNGADPVSAELQFRVADARTLAVALMHLAEDLEPRGGVSR
ncbi:hypothetical protein ACQEVB_11795 [Pseudonocardia sp. CA-107938]|uniref:hypothetical protein n=1 Tax=Pseudonocardia sp. CA-107938 TaxID=3240021 RepID=UPI003D911935